MPIFCFASEIEVRVQSPVLDRVNRVKQCCRNPASHFAEATSSLSSLATACATSAPIELVAQDCLEGLPWESYPSKPSACRASLGGHLFQPFHDLQRPLRATGHSIDTSIALIYILGMLPRSIHARFMSRLAIGCLAGLCATAFGSFAAAADLPVVQGSTVTQRAELDGASGQVYVYVGGTLPAGTDLLYLRFLFDFTNVGNTTGYMTPLLFYRSPGELYEIYTVVGIGKGFEVGIKSAPQTIPFELIDGVTVPTSKGDFTFGYINALVSSSGTPTTISPGTVDYDNPGDGGEGVAGAGTTNDWVATDITGPSPSVALGTTFSAGERTTYIFDSYYRSPIRTYSAQAVGILAAQ